VHYYRDLERKIAGESKKEIKRLLDSEDMKDEAALERTIKELDKSIQKARTKDVGGEVEEEVEEPDFSLLEVLKEEESD
jgi:actin-related protein 5